MEYLAKKSFSFLQDFAFTSINNETCTDKWNISRKRRFPFCKIVHELHGTPRNSSTHHRTPRKKLPSMEYLAKKSFSFLQDFAFTSIIINHILINGISCKKVVFLFARFCIY